MPLTRQQIYQFSDFELRVGARALLRNGIEVPLGSKAFDVLVCLVMHAEEVVTREEIFKAVWQDSYVEESALAQQISALRKALGDQAASIKTIAGRGYQFAEKVKAVGPAGDLLTGNVSSISNAGPAGGMTVQRTRERARVVIEDSPHPHELSAGSMHRIADFIRSHQRLAGLSLAIAVIVLAAGCFLGWRRLHAAKRTGYQRAVIADIDNSTGDANFDRSLKRAIQIDLDQSPHIGVMSDAEAVRILKMMGHKGDDPLTPEIAREVCERDNRQVLLTGGLAPIGSHYLLTLEASDCQSGKSLSSAKAEARSKDEVLAAIDTAAAHIRSQLGESAESVTAYDHPIEQVTTASLEALKSYSQGQYLSARGKAQAEIRPLYERAVQLDPQFAMAYAALGGGYYGQGEPEAASQYFKKAFDLRQRVGAKESLILEAHYYSEGLEDLEQGIHAYRMWATLYPMEWTPWADLSNDESQLGEYSMAVEDGERALKLGPDAHINYFLLAKAYRCMNRFADAKAVGELAVKRGRDSNDLDTVLYGIAVAEQDQAAIERENTIREKDSDKYYFYYAKAQAAFLAGRYKEGIRLLGAAHDTAQREGLAEAADEVLFDEASYQHDFDLDAEARATLKQIRKPDPDSVFIAILQTQLGNAPFGQRFLEQEESRNSQGTLMKFFYLPILRSELQMALGKPQDAIAALEPARRYELTTYDIPRTRGDAYLKANEPKMAETEFKKVIEHYGVEPTSSDIPLSHLGLARAYALDGDKTNSRSEYEKLFALWKDADPGLPPLVEAHREFSRLQ